jgi:hypothetical protein
MRAALHGTDGSTVWVRELGSGQRAYFMMPVRYWHWEGGNARPGEGGEPATYDVALAASRNGWKFSFLGERQPFARPMRDGSVGVSRMWVRPPIRMGNEDFFFVTRGNMNEDAEVANTTDGSPKRLRGEVALGRLRLDGTISIDGKYGQAGNLTTKVLVFHGKKLRLNVNAGGGGAVTVFVRTPTGKRLLGPSKPVVHNGVNEEVVWPNGCLSCLAGQPVVLSFSIEEAKLFTFRFAHKSDDVTYKQNTAAASSEPTITSKTTKTVRLWTGSRFPVATRSTDPFTLNLARYLNATEKLRDVVDVVSPSCFSIGGLNDTYSPGLSGLHMQPGCRQRVVGLHAQGFRVEPMISNGENSTIEVIRLRLREPTFVHACALAMYILNASGLVFDLELEKSDVADGLSFAEMLSAVRTKLRLHVADAVVSVATGTGAMSKTDVLVNSTVDQFISMGTYWALKYFQSGIQRDMGRVGRARYACGLCDSCAAELRGGNNTVASIDERFRSLATDEVLHLAWWLLEYDSPGSPLPASFQHKHWWQKIREWKRNVMKSDDVEPGENCHHSATTATAAVLSNSTLEWWRWVVVRVANQAAWIKPNDTDARDAFVTLFDPDMFDWGGDFRWQAGEWAGLRGIPVAQSTQFEYQMAFDGFNTSSQGTSVVLAAFGNSSVSTDVNGHPVVNGVWPYMTHAAPLWHMACVQGAARVALAGDAVTQDNAAGNLNSRVFSGGFGAWENKKFITSPFGAALGLNASFKIQSYVKTLQNKGLHGDFLVREPIISAFIRFTYELWRDAWVDLRTSAKKIAMKQGKLLPAVYGNIGNKYPVFELIESTHHDVYWIESFVHMATPAQQPEQYPGVDTTITIKAAQSAGRQKPIWRCTQDVNTQSEARIYFAEACANGANEWLLNGMMESTLPPSQSTVGTWGKINGNLVTHGYGYDEHLRHAQFSNSAARFLLTDRHRIADGAVIYCLACSLWRGLVGTLGHSSPLLFQNSLPTTGRLLEHSHASWEFVAFGHSDLWQPPPQTRVRLAAPSRGMKPYVWVVLPNVDVISDTDVNVLSAYVQGGGMLILIGLATGSLNEDLSPRAVPAFQHLQRDPGKGKVVCISDVEFDEYRHCGGFPRKCLASRKMLWDKYFRQKHEAQAQVLLPGAPLSVWLNTWEHATGGTIAAHLVNYRTNGSLDCNMSVPQPQSGPTECDCSCEVQPHDNTIQNLPVAQSFQACLRLDTNSSSSPAVAWIYSKSRERTKLVVDRHTPGFLCATVPAGMGVYAVVVWARCDAEIQARTEAASARQALERLLVASHSTGALVFGNGTHQQAAANAMHQAEGLLSQIQGDRANATTDRFQSLIPDLTHVTSMMRLLIIESRKAVLTNAAYQRKQLINLCAGVNSTCIAAFNMGLARVGQVQLAGFTPTFPNSTYTASAGFGFLRDKSTGRPGVGAVDSVVPDSLHRSFLWGSEKTVFRLDLPVDAASTMSSRNELFLTIVSGVHDFAVEPMEFLQTHYAADYTSFSTTALAVNIIGGSTKRNSTAHIPCLLGARGQSTAYYAYRTCRLHVPSTMLQFRRISLEFVLAPDSGTTGVAAGGNPFAWLINALILHRASPTNGGINPVLQAGLNQSDWLDLHGIRQWQWVGPFEASHGSGLTTEFEPERQLKTATLPWSILNQSYTGKNGQSIKWMKYVEPGGSAAPHLPFGALLGASHVAGSVAFGLCRVHSATPRTVNFRASMSGLGRLYIRNEQSTNLKLVYQDNLISGVTDTEDYGMLELAPGWNYLLMKSEHNFDSDWTHSLSAQPHFPSSAESEVWVHSLRVAAHQPNEWGGFLALDI